MKRSIPHFLGTILLLLFLLSCSKKEWDDYYARPDNLAAPIYQQLKEKGNFTNFLAVIDKSGYKDVLGQAGAWTLFAPTDDAFQAYFKEKGISGVDAIDAETARKIALYGLVYNPYRRDQLSFWQTANGQQANAAFRRRTAYYDFVYTENGKKVVGNNRNGISTAANDNNNKFIPYYIDSYLAFNGLKPNDYTDLYPQKTFSGFDVADAKVVEADIPAENGIIHVIDKVLLPPPNIDQYLASKPEYSEFKKLLDKLASYTPNSDYTQRYKVLTGSSEQVYVKTYSTALAFSPVNEGYLFATPTDGQSACWSIAVPTNDALTAYFKTILQNYRTIDDAPQSVLQNFINSHLWVNTLWPSQLLKSQNSMSELPTFAGDNVIERKVLSNAIFYGINKTQEANVFRTVYSRAYLDPRYSLMARAIDGSDLRSAVTVPSLKYTMFMISNASMALAGFNFNEDTGQWGYTAPGVSTVYDATSLARLNRFVQTSVLKTPNGEFDNLSGEGVAETFNGEYVKFKGNRIYASGNADEGSSVTVDSSKTAVNGKVYYTSGLLKFAENTVTLGSTLEKLATSTDNSVSSRFSHFFNYLSNSSLWTASGKLILGVEPGAFYTLLVPSNAAIEDAVREGRLPGNRSTGQPVFASAQQTQAQKIAVEHFILYSLINKTSVAADGQKTGNFATLLKNNVGDSRILNVSYGTTTNPSTMEIHDDSAQKAKASISYSYSNNLSNRALIHSIDKVLNF